MVHTTAGRWNEERFTTALAVTAIAVYALLLTGVTATYADVVSTCTAWPTCEGSLSVALDDWTTLLAMGHRLVSLVVGIAVLALAGWAVRLDAPRQVRVLLFATAAVYPVQVAVGALRVVGGLPWLSVIHLILAVVIFLATLVALVDWLEWETRGVTSSFTRSAAEGSKGRKLVEGRHRSTESTESLEKVRSYVALMKPRLMWLLCAVALAGMGLASASTGIAIEPSVAIGTLLGGVLAIGASGTFNNVLERDVDRRMHRTADRPTAIGTISSRNAVIFGVGLALSATLVMASLVNGLATALLLLAIAFYSIVYTVVLKPNTRQNIVLGGAVGAMPALIGWAAIEGAIGLPALILGAIVFLWTPAHFYNLALVHQDDYRRGGFPMLPIVRGERVTRRHIAYYLGATLIAVGSLAAVVALGWLYLLTGVVFAGLFLAAVVHLYHRQTPRSALVTFHTSNLFLGVLMVTIVLETVLL